MSKEEKPVEKSGVRTKPAPQAAKPQFQVVRSRRTFEDICLQIRNEVAAGRLKPGDRLPAERDLAEQLGVSRTAVREALRSLEVAGVISLLRGVNGGSFIRQGDPGIITQAVSDMILLGRISTESLTEARILLMNDALTLAAERATKADLEAMEQDIDVLDELTRSGDLARRSAHITNFYGLIARATHNEVLVMLVETTSEIFQRLLSQIGPRPRADLVAERRSIVNHLRARNAAAACEEMTNHLARLAHYLNTQAKDKARNSKRSTNA